MADIKEKIYKSYGIDIDADKDIIVKKYKFSFDNDNFSDSDIEDIIAKAKSRWQKTVDSGTMEKQIEEAKKRDHRKLGKEMDLFMMSDYGPGLPFWLPHGFTLRRTLEDFWLKLHADRGYTTIDTPIFLNRELWVEFRKVGVEVPFTQVDIHKK